MKFRNSISNIIDLHKNAPAFITGHGGSLNNFKDKIPEFQKSGGIRFDCNDWFLFLDHKPSYWVMASTIDTVKNHVGWINRVNVPVLYADSVDLTDKLWINKSVHAPYLPYDQRHHNCSPCGSISGNQCCQNIIPGRLTIQEELKKLSGHNNLYGGETVAAHMIAFALLMGCNPIYVIGLDGSYKKTGYASDKIKPRFGWELNMAAIMEDWVNLAAHAKAMDRNIIQLNREAHYDTFKFGVLTF